MNIVEISMVLILKKKKITTTINLHVILRAGVEVIKMSFISRYWQTCTTYLIL